MSDLEKLFPDSDVKLSNGETLTLKPFFFGQLPKAVKLLRPVTDALKSTGIAGFDGASLALAPDWPLRLPQLMDEGGEALMEFVAFASGKPRVWFDTLGSDDGISLTKAVFEVNGDFFIKKVAPLMGMAVPQAAIGEQLSPVLSEPATAGPTSSATP